MREVILQQERSSIKILEEVIKRQIKVVPLKKECSLLRGFKNKEVMLYGAQFFKAFYMVRLKKIQIIGKNLNQQYF